MSYFRIAVFPQGKGESCLPSELPRCLLGISTPGAMDIQAKYCSSGRELWQKLSQLVQTRSTRLLTSKQRVMFQRPQQVGNDAGIKHYYENRDTLVTVYPPGL